MMELVVASYLFSAAIKKIEPPKVPSVVQSDIEYAREMCRALGSHFQVDKDYIETHDFNGDKVQDYLMDTRGFKCGRMSDELFGSAAGKPLYVYLSKGKGKWEKAFSAFAYEYNVKRDYGQLPYFDVWIRGEVGYQVNYQRMQWNGTELEVVKQEHGVEVPDQLWKNFD